MKRFFISLIMIAAAMLGLCFAVNADDRPFLDIKTNSWYEESAMYCYDHGYMKGTATGRFSPTGKLTRAMAVQLLYSINEPEEGYGGHTFTDVKADKWFYTAVEWAYEYNIVSGTGNGRFSPNANVTRQDFYVMLYNYTLIFSHAEEADILDSYLWYNDVAAIADYALNAMNWAGYYELVSGYKDNTLRPAAYITRAEITSIMQRYDKLLGHKWIYEESAPRSCSNDGYSIFFCNDCPAVKMVTYTKGHIWYQNAVSKGTCISKGTVEYRCLNCVVIRSEVSEYGDHSFTLSSTVKPTRTQQGYSVYNCSYCSAGYRDSFTQPLGRTEGWDSNYDGKLTIDEYFGAYDIVPFLLEHQTDYLGTPYIRLSDHLNRPWMLIHDKGQYPDSPGMNCTGFVASVLLRCGANADRLNKPSSGSYGNAYNWHVTAINNKIFYYKFNSVSQALNSGLMKKGDIVLFLPAAKSEKNPEPDYHFGIFWGDYSSHNLFWHSTGATSYNWNAGVRGMKNQITGMASGTPYSSIYVFPMQRG